MVESLGNKFQGYTPKGGYPPHVPCELQETSMHMTARRFQTRTQTLVEMGEFRPFQTDKRKTAGLYLKNVVEEVSPFHKNFWGVVQAVHRFRNQVKSEVFFSKTLIFQFYIWNQGSIVT